MHRDILIYFSIPGHQLGRMGGHNVLRPRRSFVLGLDLLRAAHRGKFRARLD